MRFFLVCSVWMGDRERESGEYYVMCVFVSVCISTNEERLRSATGGGGV